MYNIDITGIAIVLGTAVILPITIVFLSLRRKMQSENNRKDIILAALEKNADIDIEELVKKMNKPEKLLKEKLLKKLMWGCIFTIIGIGLLLIEIMTFDYRHIPGKEDVWLFTGIWTFTAFGLGISFIINYFVGKKMLSKEMEAEEQNLRQA